MKQELLFSGIGGQGVITIGEVVCYAAAKAGYNATFVPFYGSEKRGGRTMCNVVVSDEVESPIISGANIMLIMDERSMTDYQDMVEKDGILIYNSNMVSLEPACECAAVEKVPFNDLAMELGNPKVANIIALGCLAKLLPMIPYDYIVSEVKKNFAAKPKLIDINLEALKKGYDLAEKFC